MPSVVGRLVKVRALKAYNEHAVGDEFLALMTEPTAQLIVNHYLEVVEDPWPTPTSTKPE